MKRNVMYKVTHQTVTSRGREQLKPLPKAEALGVAGILILKQKLQQESPLSLCVMAARARASCLVLTGLLGLSSLEKGGGDGLPAHPIRAQSPWCFPPSQANQSPVNDCYWPAKWLG